MRRWILAIFLMCSSLPALADIAPEKGGCKCSQSSEQTAPTWAALGGVALVAGLWRRGSRKAGP